MNQRYTELAHEFTIVEYLRQHLLDTFIDGNRELSCDLLPGRLKQVPKTAIIEMLERLQLEKKELEFELKKYDFVKREVRPLPRLKGPTEDDEQPEQEADEGAEQEGEAASLGGDVDFAGEGASEGASPVAGDDDEEYPDLSGDDLADGYPPGAADS